MDNSTLLGRPIHPIPTLFSLKQENPVPTSLKCFNPAAWSTKPASPALPPPPPPPPQSLVASLTTTAAAATALTQNSTDQRLRRLSRDGKVEEAIAMLQAGSTVATKTYISLLQSCIDSKSILQGRQLHEKIGLVRNPNPFVDTKLVSMYAKCGDLDRARKVFAGMRQRNLFTWSAMINGYAREQMWEQVLDLFFHMMEEGVVPDAFLFPKFLQACANTGDAEAGRLLHSLAVRMGLLELAVEAHVSNSILAMYAKCCEMDSAKKFFNEMCTRDLVSWNSLISGCCQCGENEEALGLFERMQTEGIKPGLVTWNILITSYNQMGRLDVAMGLMKKMGQSGLVPDVVTWTSMISGFVQNNRAGQALDLFHKMQSGGVEPNRVTFASAISACASLKDCRKGNELHAYAVKAGCADKLLVSNSLIDMYAKCGRLEDAQRIFRGIADRDVFTWNSLIGGYAQNGYCGKAYDLFSKMADSGVPRNVVTWNVMISGYLQNGDVDQAMELFRIMESEGIGRSTASWNLLISGSLQNCQKNMALRIFRQMQFLGKRPNHITMLSVLPACANILSTLKVKEIHACTFRTGLLSEVSVANSLVDTYMKSGNVILAESVFSSISSIDVLSWNSMIEGYILHGQPQTAIDLFNQMKKEVKPDQVTFTSVLRAYGLQKMVNEGRELFSSMTDVYQMQPIMEHYAAMVQLLSHCGRLKEASEFIKKMPLEPDSNVWAALLTASRRFGNLDLANHAIGHLLSLKSKNTVIKRLSLQIHALYGETNDTLKTSKPGKVADGGDDETLGCCWIEVKNKVHTILTGDMSWLGSEPVSNQLDSITNVIKLPERDFPHRQLIIEEEEKEETVGIHSEKIALAFSLIGSTCRSIRIIKSLRICTDCHDTARFISKAFQREIMIKDPESLHHFKDGRCSCGEYW
uniref:Pentatricopeptide repeat-containing protein At1g19720 n=1 Tax=Anthurium amnicola TaxID=1678845 RepID=A0A1D1YFF5_9ARAE